MLTKMHARYSGLWQSCPLTPEEQKYDETCREIDRLENVIGEKPMGLFTAAEYMGFQNHVQRMYICPPQSALDRQLAGPAKASVRS